MERYQEIERSIIKKFRPSIWHRFVKAVSDYNLIEEDDKIAVCISGGKDSFLLAKCLEELQKHGKIKFDLEYIIMNPGYSNKVLLDIKNNLDILNIKAHIFDSNIFKVIKNEKNPCYLCARMRRGYLYNYAKKLGCNKIALGHHFDDAVQTILLNLIYNGMYAGMMPKLKSENFEGMELIRPLYLVREDDIIAFWKYNGISFTGCGCGNLQKTLGKREEVKKVINFLKSIYHDADINILNSMSNVKVDKVINYYKTLGPIFYDSLIDMIVFDAIILNTDRHFGNFGLLIDNKTNKIIKPAPLFDHGLSLLNFAMADDLKNYNKYIKTLLPSCYNDFILEAKLYITKRQKDMLKKLINFKLKKHSRYNLDKYRLNILENIIKERINILLNI